jgi:hypothetical protein
VFFNSPNPSSRTMVLGSTQPLTEMSIKNLPGGKGRPARKADNLTAICDPIVWKMWEPRRLTILWAFTACYRDSFTFISAYIHRYSYEWEQFNFTVINTLLFMYVNFNQCYTANFYASAHSGGMVGHSSCQVRPTHKPQVRFTATVSRKLTVYLNPPGWVTIMQFV